MSQPLTQRRVSFGLTLLELLVCVILLVLLCSTTSYALKQIIPQQRITADTNAVLGFIRMTRADAMGTGDRLLCDGNSDCSTFGRTRSLVMGHDRNGDQRLSKMEVLRKLQLTGKVILVWKRFRGTFLGYQANGNSRFQNGSFYICNDVAARRIVMNWIGRPRIEAATPGDCD